MNLATPLGIEHDHDIGCGHGMRAVPISVELLTEFLHGRCTPAEAMNVPPDLQVLYSTRHHAARAGTVVLVCFSAAWDRKEDIDPETNDVRVFVPEYRRIS
jgi:hypothetical protein